MDKLVTTKWLADAIGQRDLVILDATYHVAMPGFPPRDAAAEYAQGHIPGARFMDLGELSRIGERQPTALPAAERFASRMRALGIGDGDRIVLYDDSPFRSSARAWWLFRVFAPHMPVAILDGGIAAWRAEGRPVETAAASPAPRHFTVDPDMLRVRVKADMRANIDSGVEQVLDARSAARFDGTEPDPRGLPTGHIPGSANLPYGRLFDADGRWKQGDALAAAFADAGIDPERPVATTCGSGVTAAVLAFGLHLLGRDAALYDGSWSEWAADPAMPKATA